MKKIKVWRINFDFEAEPVSFSTCLSIKDDMVLSDYFHEMAMK